jgi:GNAT superfamily N-acetyltransferase
MPDGTPTAEQSSVRIEPARAVAHDVLADFYRDVFPGRLLEERWSWLYRRGLWGGALPLLAMDDGRAIAQAGGIPFVLQLDGGQYRAAWFVDFAVRAGLQGRGVGTRLARAWMEVPDIAVTFCNEESMRVFRKLGWVGSFDTWLHTMWIRPFDHARAALLGPTGRSFGNALAARVWRRWLRPSAFGEPRLEPFGPEHANR